MNHGEQVAQSNEVFKRIASNKRDTEISIAEAIQAVVDRFIAATGVDIESVDVVMINRDSVGARTPRCVGHVHIGLGLPGRLV